MPSIQAGTCPGIPIFSTLVRHIGITDHQWRQPTTPSRPQEIALARCDRGFGQCPGSGPNWALMSSPRKRSSTIRIPSLAEKCRRLSWRMASPPLVRRFDGQGISIISNPCQVKMNRNPSPTKSCQTRSRASNGTMPSRLLRNEFARRRINRPISIPASGKDRKQTKMKSDAQRRRNCDDNNRSMSRIDGPPLPINDAVKLRNRG